MAAVSGAQNVHRYLISSISNASVVVKSSIAAISVFYLFGLIPSIYSVLSITPGFLVPPNFRIWTLITGVVMEGSIFNVIIDIPILIVCGSHIEPIWGALELLKFILITGVGTALQTSFLSLLVYAASGNYDMWFVQFSGLAGVIGGISVAFKQISPDVKLDLRVRQFRVQDLPILTILISTFLSVVHLLPYTQPIMVTCGIIIGWIYLRFYQPRGKGMRGDMSEAFEFASFFPSGLSVPIRFLCNMLFGLMVRLGLCKMPVRTYDVGAPSSITISLPGTDPIDAERRRKKALRALNERLSRLQKNQSKSEEAEDWPTIEDELNKVSSSDSKNASLTASNEAIDSDSSHSAHLDSPVLVEVDDGIEPT